MSFFILHPILPKMWLILETSGRTGRVGLARGEAIVRAAALDDTRRHARDLAAAVGQMLDAVGVKPRELEGVVVSRGPGSYTGLRVGIMSAKALAYAVGCRLVAVDTFAAIAVQAPAAAGRLWVIADALQGQVYRQQFLRGAGTSWAAADDLRIASFEEWEKALTPGDSVTGPGLTVYGGRLPSGFSLVPEADREPRVESLFAVGRHLAPLTVPEVFALEPLYLRGSSAEEKAKGAAPGA
jgi:tRNA threonylcarbamoyladenosine biosynthesis protein TsaB